MSTTSFAHDRVLLRALLLRAGQVVAANKLDAASGGPITIVEGRVEGVKGIGHDQGGRGTLAGQRTG